MSLENFHPTVQRWFSETLGDPTPAQRQGWASIAERRNTLIAAPTGSGKTLAAFLTAMNDLFLERDLPDEVRVVYVSPLKALSADIHKNLAEPRKAIRALDPSLPKIAAAVRTGDTTQSERAAMLRKPPHILVTTPESLYLLLTAERSREMLRTARTVIVDEIHAVIGTRRGAHLALTLERLQKVAKSPLQRVGLSATQKPIEEVARYLCGRQPILPVETGEIACPPPCAIVDEGHRRAMDITIEMPRSAVETVMANEVWEEYYARLAQLIAEHRTTLVFVNTRRMAERAARHLADIIGEDAVTAHHGSLSKEKRLDAESRLKSGQLKALVATASLELGIDIGHVDLVCQIGSPHRIATFLQRVGRSGHTVSGMPKGRLFPISKDDLVECAALLRAVSRGELDCIVSQDAPLDVLAQQIVAESACDDYAEDDLFALVRRAHPYRNLRREDFDAVVRMVNEGFATKNGRRGALVHRDEVNGRVRARRGSRMTAITNGGAIPEVADYRVMLEPGDTFIGTLNEDFAIESNAGDIFQLGNASWQILQVGSGVVRVADAKGAPPSIPFWLGEAPARSDELSRAVSDLRGDMDFTAVPETAAQEIKSYFDETRRILGVMPTQEAIVAERFFDESGGMQLIIHAPFGSRINRAWGLALRKRFCRQFNFELQAAATEDAILLSLGPQHSFPLADVFHYLHPATARDVLVQAFLDAPVFQTRWRWNTTISLAIPRNRHGKRIPPPLQRAMADDLMAAVFPDAAACFENIRGDRELPDHPLVNQTVRDCLSEAMDFDGLARVLDKIHRGEIQCVAVDTVEPSPLAHDIINARPFQFLDDAPLEERRTQAVYTGRSGILDDSAIERVREEARPDPRDADELHDALLSASFLLDGEFSREMMEQLMAARRAGVVDPSSAASRHLLPASGEKDSVQRLSLRVGGEKDSVQRLSLRVGGEKDSVQRLSLRVGGEKDSAWTASASLGDERDSAQSPSPRVSGERVAEGRVRGELCVAAERLPEMLAVHPQRVNFAAPPSRIREWTREEAIVELLRGRLTIAGPVTIGDLAQSLQISDSETEQALIKLESEGVVLRTNGNWCDRRLLARIHRYTLNRLRAEIEPLSPTDFVRFLFAWQHVAQKLSGADGLRKIVAQLEGYEVPANAWEKFILPARVERFDVSTLDTLCLTGEIGWAKLTSGIGIFPRDHATAWLQSGGQTILSVRAHEILDQLRSNGASFLKRDEAVDELIDAGLITSDGFLGRSGRWSLCGGQAILPVEIEVQAWALLRRYGVVFRRLVAREPNAAPWRDLARIYRTLEARGEIRGGRFVTGMSGEQFALAEAVERMREIRREGNDGRLLVISAADPLNLTGIVDPAERVRATPSTRIAYRDGVAVSVMEGDFLRPLTDVDPSTAMDAATALAGRRVPVASGFVGRA